MYVFFGSPCTFRQEVENKYDLSSVATRAAESSREEGAADQVATWPTRQALQSSSCRLFGAHSVGNPEQKVEKAMAHGMGVAIVDTDWQNFLLPGSDIPPDVCFLVKDATDGESGSSESIGAHKLLLAGSSPVFRRQFFGPMRETGEVVEVKDTRPEAFETMIRYIYRSPGATTFTLAAISCPQELIEVHELANRYQIRGLKEMTDSALDTLVITRDNMIFTASIAQKFKNTEFEDISKKLQMRCLKFLYDTTNGAHDMVALIQKTKESFPDADLNILCELINLGNVELGLQGDFFCRYVSRLLMLNFSHFQVGAGSSSSRLKNGRLLRGNLEPLPLCPLWANAGRSPLISSHWCGRRTHRGLMFRQGSMQTEESIVVLSSLVRLQP